MFGVDYSDPGLRLFVNEYVKAGGNPNLECYMEYFFQMPKIDHVDTIAIQQIIKSYGYSTSSFYTPEEDTLHQRLVDALNVQVQRQKIKK